MTINNRLTKLRHRMSENNIESLLVSQPENRYYLSGFFGSAGFLLITASRAVLATDFRYVEQAGYQAPAYEIYRTSGDIATWFPDLTASLEVRSLGFEAGDITYILHHRLRDALNNRNVPLKLVPTEGIVESLRAVKDADEIRNIENACRLADAAFDSVAANIRPGMTELQIAWELEKHMHENGSQAVPFEIIVASGPNAALPHARPSERPVAAGEPIVIDMGARYNGYVSDLSRTLCLGTPDATFKKVYGTVLDAQTAAMSIINEGTSGDEADRMAREVINNAGYGEAFGHALGHGVGLAAHELPRLGPGAEALLTDGTVFTVEPGIYLPGWGGVRIEDTVVLKDNQAQAITNAGKVIYD